MCICMYTNIVCSAINYMSGEPYIQASGEIQWGSNLYVVLFKLFR